MQTSQKLYETYDFDISFPISVVLQVRLSVRRVDHLKVPRACLADLHTALQPILKININFLVGSLVLLVTNINMQLFEQIQYSIRIY